MQNENNVLYEYWYIVLLFVFFLLAIFYIYKVRVSKNSFEDRDCFDQSDFQKT